MGEVEVEFVMVFPGPTRSCLLVSALLSSSPFHSPFSTIAWKCVAYTSSSGMSDVSMNQSC